MKSVSRKLILSAAIAAAATVLAYTAGPSIAGGVTSAAPLAPLASLDADAGPVILATDFKCCGKGRNGITPRPGDFEPNPTEGGKGGKGAEGGNGNWGAVVGGAIVLGLTHCAIRSERCEEEHGEDTERYWRCMRRAGC